MKNSPRSPLALMLHASWSFFVKVWGCFLCAGGMVLLAGCAGEPPSGLGAGLQGGASIGPGYPAGSGAWSEADRGAYRMAFSAGMEDQREGYRFDDDRGASLLDQEVRGVYRQGYRRGYYHEATVRRMARQPEASAAAGQSGHENHH